MSDAPLISLSDARSTCAQAAFVLGKAGPGDMTPEAHKALVTKLDQTTALLATIEAWKARQRGGAQG